MGDKKEIRMLKCSFPRKLLIMAPDEINDIVSH